QSSIQNFKLVGHSSSPIKITVSIGLVIFEKSSISKAKETTTTDVNKLMEFALSQADGTMYEVKRAGRDGIKERVL
ncbi:MAG: hypothetical protein P1U57_10885, partial [Oleibacter sp.]|nr:hypothetical protein [Thalassolituus sp.]